ncbi:MAG: hypothetical protein JSS66_03315 [Armatimonadetes bacterium]|nr:hypothetical protein [Armatimonadota bacterium]
MGFSDETKKAAFERCGGRCECTRSSCSMHYMTRCQMAVKFTTATYHHKKDHTIGDVDRLTNCEVLCATCAHQAELDTFSAGFS